MCDPKIARGQMTSKYRIGVNRKALEAADGHYVDQERGMSVEDILCRFDCRWRLIAVALVVRELFGNSSEDYHSLQTLLKRAAGLKLEQSVLEAVMPSPPHLHDQLFYRVTVIVGALSVGSGDALTSPSHLKRTTILVGVCRSPSADRALHCLNYCFH